MPTSTHLLLFATLATTLAACAPNPLHPGTWTCSGKGTITAAGSIAAYAGAANQGAISADCGTADNPLTITFKPAPQETTTNAKP